MNEQIFLYNTISGLKERFIPLNSNKVKIYVCGPTVYDSIHLGNARSLVVFDLLYRLLKYTYPNVCYVRNITDVDDKINTLAAKNNITIQELTLKTISLYQEDSKFLLNLPPTHEPKATDFISNMINIIQKLIDNENAYVSDYHVLFRVKSFKNYGSLSKNKPINFVPDEKDEFINYKEDPRDFVLWKPSKKASDPKWESPWGLGRPGWHIECSAMSSFYFGSLFDIHGGGSDLIFPHHENEIAQSCSVFNTDYTARYWVHNGPLTIKKWKMSKSIGNIIKIEDLAKKYDGEIIRFALISKQYRSSLDWNETIISKSITSLRRFYLTLREANYGDSVLEENTNNLNNNNKICPKFLEALCNDLNTPLAISYLHDLASSFNKTKEIEFAILLRNSANILLGILNQNPNKWLKEGQYKLENQISLSNDIIEEAILKRNIERKSKNFFEADRIKNYLLSYGIILEDRPEGTIWRRK